MNTNGGHAIGTEFDREAFHETRHRMLRRDIGALETKAEFGAHRSGRYDAPVPAASQQGHAFSRKAKNRVDIDREYAGPAGIGRLVEHGKLTGNTRIFDENVEPAKAISRRDPSISTAMTRAPSSAKRSAMARPIPSAAPVTSARRPAR